MGVTHLALALCAAVAAAETFTIVDAKERYVQPVGCIEPAAEGGWHLSISWVRGVPCKPASKARTHAVADIADMECTAAKCVLPRPGTTFRSTLLVDVVREPSHETRPVQASINVLRHEPPFLFLAIETTDHADVSAFGEIRVKLYKRVADKVDPESWRPDP